MLIHVWNFSTYPYDLCIKWLKKNSISVAIFIALEIVNEDALI